MSDEASTKQGGKRGAGVGVAMIIAVLAIWYNNNPRYWLMPDLESGSAMGTVFKALSPDDPATPEVFEGKTLGEPMSDRSLFIEWARGAAFDRSTPIPLTVGGAIEAQRASVIEAQRMDAEFRGREAKKFKMWQEATRRDQLQRQQHAAEQERRQAVEHASREAEWASQRHAEHQAQATRDARATARREEEAACGEEYTAVYDAYIEAPSAEGGAEVSEAASAKNECLDRVGRKWGSD